MNNEVSMNDEGVMDSILKKTKKVEPLENFDPALLKDVIYQLHRSNQIKERILKNMRFFFWLTVSGIFLSLISYLVGLNNNI